MSQEALRDWEKEFDNELCDMNHTGLVLTDEQEYLVKSFIKTLLSAHIKEVEQNIGMLRQWLNEDRITDPNKMVTNEDIKHWLTQHHG